MRTRKSKEYIDVTFLLENYYIKKYFFTLLFNYRLTVVVTVGITVSID